MRTDFLSKVISCNELELQSKEEQGTSSLSEDKYLYSRDPVHTIRL